MIRGSDRSCRGDQSLVSSASGLNSAEMRCQMVAEITRVVGSAVDQCGLSAPQELHAHQVDAGRAEDDAAVMDDRPDLCSTIFSMSLVIFTS